MTNPKFILTILTMTTLTTFWQYNFEGGNKFFTFHSSLFIFIRIFATYYANQEDTAKRNMITVKDVNIRTIQKDGKDYLSYTLIYKFPK